MYSSWRNALIILCLIASGLPGCEDEPLRQDESGEFHGTGEKVYRYQSGSVMLREKYVDGQLEHSRWYKPDGTLVEETDWKDESGEGIYLREDGTIEARMHYVNGVAEGKATFYDENGNVSKVVTYEEGRPVETIHRAATQPASGPAG